MIGLEIGIISLLIIVIIIFFIRSDSSIKDDDLKKIKRIIEDNKAEEIYYNELKGRLDKLESSSKDLQLILTKILSES